MHFLLIIFFILFLIFGDKETKIKMAQFFGGVALWIWGFIVTLDAATDENIAYYVLGYLFATIVGIVLWIRHAIKKWDES